MGIYDRDYARNDEKGIFLGGQRSMVVNLLLINVGVFLVQVLFDGKDEVATRFLSLNDNLLSQPWRVFELVTYGFTHSPTDIGHIAFNMLGLFIFGRGVEERYGPKNLLWIYLTAVVLAGLAWLMFELGDPRAAQLVGASGAVVALAILFCVLYPNRTILLMFVLPIPAWVLGVLYIVTNVFGFAADTTTGASEVAYVAHLAGILYAFAYYKTQFTLLWLWPAKFTQVLKRRPRLKVHDPGEREEEMDVEVDKILDKIRTQGQESLTARERRQLERASRRYQQKHR